MLILWAKGAQPGSAVYCQVCVIHFLPEIKGWPVTVSTWFFAVTLVREVFFGNSQDQKKKKKTSVSHCIPHNGTVFAAGPITSALLLLGWIFLSSFCILQSAFLSLFFHQKIENLKETTCVSLPYHIFLPVFEFSHQLWRAEFLSCLLLTEHGRVHQALYCTAADRQGKRNICTVWFISLHSATSP